MVNIIARWFCSILVIALIHLPSGPAGLAYGQVDYQPKMELHAYNDPGKIAVNVANFPIHRAGPSSAETKLTVSLCIPGVSDRVSQETTSGIFGSAVDAVFDMRELPIGEYAIVAKLTSPEGVTIGVESKLTFEWKGQTETFKNVKIVNNFVWEILNVKGDALSDLPKKFVFNNPGDRWVYIKSRAKVAKDSEVRLSVDSDSKEDAAITHYAERSLHLRLCVFCPRGSIPYSLITPVVFLWRNLVIRLIPVLQYSSYNGNPHIRPQGPYDWEFLRKDVLPNVNVVISAGEDEPAHLKEWAKMGRKWISDTTVPKITEADENALDKICDFWSSRIGLRHPLMSGIIVDEFSGGNDLVYDLYRKAVERIYSDPKYKGRAFIPYAGQFYRKDRSTGFAKTCIEGGGYICWERYLSEEKTPEAAMATIRRSFLTEMQSWEDGLPGSTKKMIIALGYMSQPTESLNIDPTVDFKVFMDMQIRFLATHPAFFGLGGVQEYDSSYSDEERCPMGRASVSPLLHRWEYGASHQR